MKVLYDYDAFTYQKFGGVSKSLCELIKRLPDDIDYEIAIATSNNSNLIDSCLVPDLLPYTFDIKGFLPCFDFKGKYQLYHFLSNNMPGFNSVDRLNRQMSIKALKAKAYDVFHATGFKTYSLDYIGDKPMVYTIHDMTTELFCNSRGMAKQTEAIHKLASRADHVITVSENTKRDVMRLIGLPEDKITVVYHGGPNIEKNKYERTIESPYILYIGGRQSYKNFNATLKAFSFVHKKYKDVCLVCTGASFLQSEKEYITALGLDKFVIQMFASDLQLKSLYQNAIAFVYPSLYEGFGMPILEAFSNGCPVLLNRKSCFPEIAGDAAIYFNSDETECNMKDAFDKILQMKRSERNNLVSKGYARLADYSWDESANKLASIYNKLI